MLPERDNPVACAHDALVIIPPSVADRENGILMRSKPSQWRKRSKFAFSSDQGTLALESRQLLSADVLTYHNNSARTGVDTTETTLTPQNVNSQDFGKLASLPVDGAVFAQPLYMSNLNIPGKGVHNVVFIATQHDSIYAFDADNYELLWHDSFIDPDHGVTPVANTDLPEYDVIPEIGIMSTPVIDPATNTMYFVDRVKVVANGKPFFSQQLGAIDVTTGALKIATPTNITATVPGRGAGSVRGKISFDPLIELQRSALLLDHGVIYIDWSVQKLTGSNHGWLMAYDANTLQQISAYADTPNAKDGGIWMAGDGPAADADGNVYIVTGSGVFNGNRGGKDFADSVLKFRIVNGKLKMVDYFAPSNAAYLNAHDLDFGSGGDILLPDQPGPIPHLMVAAGKTGSIYLLNRDNLGKFAKKDRAVQIIPNAIVAAFDTPAFFNNTLYYVGTAERKGGAPDTVRAFKLVNGKFNPVPTTGKFTYGYPGSSPTISANGTQNGILWTVDNGAFTLHGPAILRAYDANDVTNEIYDSTQNPADEAGGSVKFIVPTVANGKVFVGGFGTVTVYGLKTK